MGWSMVDVVGDGNYGYYSLLLDFENCEHRRYVPDQQERVYPPTLWQNIPWQVKIIQF
jgi:hypothetical protein